MAALFGPLAIYWSFSMMTLPVWLHHEMRHWSTAPIVALVLLFGLASSDLITPLSLTREGLAAAQWWRLFTSHIVHLNFAHALLNASGFLLVSLAFRPWVSAAREFVVVLVAMPGVSLGVACLNPEIGLYAGLSGVVHALFAHHLVLAARHSPRLAGVWLAALAVKVFHEQYRAAPDRAMEQLIGGSVAVDAHLYGALIGLLLGLGALCLQWLRANSQP